MYGSTKRKRAETDSDEDEPSLGRQVLPVANLPNDFTGEPMDGLQYLFTVRRDARRLPHVTRAANPYEIKEAVEPSPALQKGLPSSKRYLPTEDWRELFLQRFRHFRKNSVQSYIGVNQPPNSATKVIPDRKERDAWWAFLAGKPESDWNPPKKPKAPKTGKKRKGMRGFADSPSLEEEETSSTFIQTYQVVDNGEVVLTSTVEADSIASSPAASTMQLPPPSAHPSAVTETQHTLREPTPILLRTIDHGYSLHLLMYFTHWINLHLDRTQPRAHQITDTHARWMFALLSRVDDYLSADEMALLRNLARACMSLLKERLQRPPDDAGDDTSISESSCWMIITAVVGIWGQKDLWMDVESILSELE